MGIEALDTFSDPDATVLSAHKADYGLGSGNYAVILPGVGELTIYNNVLLGLALASYATGNGLRYFSNEPVAALLNDLLQYINYEHYVDAWRPAVLSGGGRSRMGLYIKAGAGAVGVSEGRVQFGWADTYDADRNNYLNMDFRAFNDDGTVLRAEVDIPVAWPLNTGLRFGVTVIQGAESIAELYWVEPYRGGLREVIYAADGSQRIAYGRTGFYMYQDIGDDDSTGFFLNAVTETVSGLTPTNLPVIYNQLTYQRVVNVARNRSRDFSRLVLDNMQVMDELNAITLELVQEGSDADVSAFQETMDWANNVAPSLAPVPTDLTEVNHILVPGWVQTIFAVEGVRSNGAKIEIAVQRKESETRDRIPDQDEGFGFYTALLDERLRKPRAWRVWDPEYSVWRLYKDLTSAGGEQTWQDIVDANLVVSGVRIAMTERPDLTDTIPLPFRALRPLAEAYAIILGGQTNKSVGWMRDQRAVKQKAFDDFREFINQSDMSRDEPFDPEIGVDWQ